MKAIGTFEVQRMGWIMWDYRVYDLAGELKAWGTRWTKRRAENAAERVLDHLADRDRMVSMRLG